jgi:hypothetical protein
MRLILSCLHNVNSVTDKDHLLLIINTETKEIEFIPLNVSETNDIIGSKGMCMSGDYLMVSLKTNGKSDKFLIIDVATKRNQLTKCIKSKDVHAMVSVFRGRVYCISTGTDAMNNIVLSPSTNNIMRDVKHYSLDGGGSDIYHATSLINWNRKWYISSFGKGWKNNDFSNGSIIELSKNNRIVYSNIIQPNSLFFNRNDEMCFCESGTGLFHCGRNIIHVGGYPRGVIEDPYEKGYWIALSAERKDIPTVPARLIFINHQGLMDNEIIIPHTYDIYSIVEAEGYLSKLL